MGVGRGENVIPENKANIEKEDLKLDRCLSHLLSIWIQLFLKPLLTSHLFHL